MMCRCEVTWKWIVGLLVLAGLLSAISSAAAVAAETPASLRDGAWTWGYVIRGKIPGDVPFVFPGGSGCSLETAATYLGTPNVVLMNGVADAPPGEPPAWMINSVAEGNPNWWTTEDLDRLKGCKRVLCTLHAGDAATAAKISALSKQYPNVVGAMVDDFYPTEAKMPVEKLKATYEALKSENPSLKLYVVRYTNCKDEELIPYLPYFDVINLWVWVADKKAWGSEIDERIEKLKQVTHKPIVMGLFLHDYGPPPPKDLPKNASPWSWTKPVPLDIIETQFVKTTELLRKGKIEGFTMLQNGWLDHETHRPQVQWTKQYLDWLFQTQTVRN